MFIVFLNSYLNNFVIWLRSCYAGAGICSFLILCPSKRKVLLTSGKKLGCISQGSISSMIIDSLWKFYLRLGQRYIEARDWDDLFFQFISWIYGYILPWSNYVVCMFISEMSKGLWRSLQRDDSASDSRSF